MESLWSILLIVGPLLLLGAMVFAWMKNRSMTPAEEERSDAATRALRRDIEDDPEPPANL